MADSALDLSQKAEKQLAESEEEIKPLDESERGEWKRWLKAQHSEN